MKGGQEITGKAGVKEGKEVYILMICATFEECDKELQKKCVKATIEMKEKKQEVRE